MLVDVIIDLSEMRKQSPGTMNKDEGADTLSHPSVGPEGAAA